MKTFYCILSVPIRPESDEKIALGLLLSDGQNSIFHYSTNKLRIIGDLVNDEQHKFIKRYLKSIEAVSHKVDGNIDKIQFSESSNELNVVLNEPYFEYLSTYNKNVLFFSKPIRIDLPVNEEIYKRLFEKYIDTEKIRQEKQLKSVSKIREEFLPKVVEYFSEEKEITENDYPSIIIPVTVDLFGKNEDPVYAQFIDLERRNLNYIKNDYYDLKQLKDAIEKGKGFLITSEPNKENFNRQHDIWVHIRKAREFEIVDASEVEKIRQYAQEHDVKPF